MSSTSLLSRSSSSSSSVLSCEEGSESSHPPVTEGDLCESFMQVGARLFSSCPELFSNAMSQLTNQLSLAVAKNPSVLHPQKTCVECNVQPLEKKKHTPFRRYMLPKDAPPEFYQCMSCGERRSENSFQNDDHMHFGKKPNVRWYCPLCKSFFAVTHRSGHIKCKHPCSESASLASSPTCSSPDFSDVVISRKRLERPESSSSSPSYLPEQEPVIPAAASLVLPSSSTCYGKEEQEEEVVEVPVQKRACLCSEPVLNNSNPSESDDYVNTTTTTTTTTSEEGCSIYRVPSTPLFPSIPAPSDLNSDDCIPAFRCPSYVLMPNDRSENDQNVVSDDSDLAFFM